MKTIFLTIFQGVEAKNLLRTNVYRTLIGHDDIRLVLLVSSEERRDFYAKEFSHPRVAYEVVNYRVRFLSDRLFANLKFLLLRTDTTDLRRRMRRDDGGSRAGYFANWLLNRLFARPWVRIIIRWADAHMVRDHQYAAIFDRWHPDAVLLAHLFDESEIGLLREARRRGVPTIGFINSWDKVTARAMIRLLPDSLLVFNDIVRAEVIEHDEMPSGRITVVGIPQYDRYVGWRPTPRAEFLQKIGFRPDERMLLFAPIGETFSQSDWDMIDLLHAWESQHLLPAGLRLFVRFQPNDRASDEEIAGRPWLRYDRPGTRFTKARGVDWDMSDAELAHLADTLFHASLLVCYASSISIDMAIFDKPVININFEIYPALRLSRSPTQFYRMAHYQRAVASGGIRMVSSEDALQEWIRRYDEDATLDHEGRRRLVAEQCGTPDGRAGERIARAILDIIHL